MNSQTIYTQISGSLTKRELFSAMAMQGLLGDQKTHWTTKDFAIAAIEYADALLKELDK